MFKKVLVVDQFYNKIVVRVKIPIQMEFKIPIQMDFFEYLKKLRKIGSVMRPRFRLKFQFKWVLKFQLKWTFINT